MVMNIKEAANDQIRFQNLASCDMFLAVVLFISVLRPSSLLTSHLTKAKNCRRSFKLILRHICKIKKIDKLPSGKKRFMEIQIRIFIDLSY